MMDFLVIWLLCAGVGAMLQGWQGAALGLMLGPIGVAIAVWMAAKQ